MEVFPLSMHAKTQKHKSAVLAISLWLPPHVCKTARNIKMCLGRWKGGEMSKGKRWTLLTGEGEQLQRRPLPTAHSIACRVWLWTTCFVKKVWSYKFDLLQGSLHPSAGRAGWSEEVTAQPHCCSSSDGCKTALPVSLQALALSPPLPAADLEAQQTIKISTI